MHQRPRAWLDDRFVPSIYPLPTSALESGASLSLIGEKEILCIDVLARTRVRVLFVPHHGCPSEFWNVFESLNTKRMVNHVLASGETCVIDELELPYCVCTVRARTVSTVMFCPVTGFIALSQRHSAIA